jgi:hypothetical protein
VVVVERSIHIGEEEVCTHFIGGEASVSAGAVDRVGRIESKAMTIGSTVIESEGVDDEGTGGVGESDNGAEVLFNEDGSILTVNHGVDFTDGVSLIEDTVILEFRSPNHGNLKVLRHHLIEALEIHIGGESEVVVGSSGDGKVIEDAEVTAIVVATLVDITKTQGDASMVSNSTGEGNAFHTESVAVTGDVDITDIELVSFPGSATVGAIVDIGLIIVEFTIELIDVQASEVTGSEVESLEADISVEATFVAVATPIRRVINHRHDHETVVDSGGVIVVVDDRAKVLGENGEERLESRAVDSLEVSNAIPLAIVTNIGG